MLKNNKILLVDDEEGILDLLELTLKKERYHNITRAVNGEETLVYIKEREFDLILLDVMLPDFNGFDLCREIRKHTDTEIIFLTSCSSDFDKITGLGIGGDDYITKPFNPMEVVARMEVLFRRQNRYKQTDTQKTLDYGIFVLKQDDAELLVNGKSVACTAKEWKLLQFFFRNPNRIFTTTEIYEHVWTEIGIEGDKTVAMHISNIRKKLETDPQSPKYIVNLRGIGYKFVPPTNEENI